MYQITKLLSSDLRGEVLEKVVESLPKLSLSLLLHHLIRIVVGPLCAIEVHRRVNRFRRDLPMTIHHVLSTKVLRVGKTVSMLEPVPAPFEGALREAEISTQYSLTSCHAPIIPPYRIPQGLNVIGKKKNAAGKMMKLNPAVAVNYQAE